MGRAPHALHADSPILDDDMAVPLLDPATQALVRDPEYAARPVEWEELDAERLCDRLRVFEHATEQDLYPRYFEGRRDGLEPGFSARLLLAQTRSREFFTKLHLPERRPKPSFRRVFLGAPQGFWR